ncbi:helix-turn-helix domain-containing protein [Paenibacillus glycinis]|uniref:Helix-turn-helix domain-containing protein n=1 Tax=Paenibacillus glycinis TaxID=2697035 RepID=A0ABW9XTP4_9BACL|nr:helix-turn-helix domain-containing protein [Paenibacillus glycinis]NBD25709.1 helix-turn-helix domain-containing protein [Paenibacillus glycinis]
MHQKPPVPLWYETPKKRPPGVLATELYDKAYGYFCHRSKGTKDWLLMFTLSGKGIVENDDAPYECTSGDLVLIPPGTPHDFYTAANSVWKKMWCHFTPKAHVFSWLSLPKEHNGFLYLRLGQSSMRQQVEHAFERLIRYNQGEPEAFAEELSVNALEEILLLLAKHHHEDDARLDPRIKEVMDYLLQHYAQPVQIKELANKVYLSPSRLAHLFKEQVGHTIVDIIQKERLKQAAKLLLNTKKSVIEISMDVGFNSSAFFARKFLQFYGMNPSDYRKRGMGTKSGWGGGGETVSAG